MLLVWQQAALKAARDMNQPDPSPAQLDAM
jgi:hypothetical protein